MAVASLQLIFALSESASFVFAVRDGLGCPVGLGAVAIASVGLESILGT